MRKVILIGLLVSMPDLFWGIAKIGLGCWGFSQKNAYGNVSGSILAISGVNNLLRVRF